MKVVRRREFTGRFRGFEGKTTKRWGGRVRERPWERSVVKVFFRQCNEEVYIGFCCWGRCRWFCVRVFTRETGLTDAGADSDG